MNIHIGKYIRPKIKTPDVLFYKLNTSNIINRDQTNFIAFTTTKPTNYGRFITSTMNTLFRPDYNGKALTLDLIKVHDKYQGLGKKIIDFVKNYSKQNGCNGYIVTTSYCGFTPNKIPHLFYRKQGFSTLDKAYDKELDKFIKNNQYATQYDFFSKLMYYPELKRKENFFEKTFNKIINLFNSNKK